MIKKRGAFYEALVVARRLDDYYIRARLGLDRLIPKRTTNPKLNENTQRILEPHRFSLPLSSTQNLIFDYNPSEFVPDGTYVINWPTPPEFSEFKGIDVSRIELEDRSSQYVGIQTYFNITYRAQRASFAYITDRRILLVTESSPDGLVYLFEGDFIRDPGYHADTITPVLYGKLTKTKDGQKIAEGHFYFRLLRLRD